MAAGGSDVDAFYFQPFQDLGAYQANGWVEPLDEYFQDDEDFDVEDFLDIPVEQGTGDDGKLYAVPVFDEHYVLYYNKDYFQEAGIEKVPETYEELIETAKKLTDPDKNRYGISMRGDGFASVLTWITVARAYGADYFKDGVCDLTSPEAKKAIEVYQELLKYSPPGYLSKGWSETSDDFAQGIAAMRIDCDTQYTYATDPESSLVADSVGFAVVPKGDVKASGSESGWSLAMSAGSENKGAAWEFIRWASGKEMDVYAAAQGNFSARESTWENEEVLKTYPEDLVEAVLAVSAPEISDGGTLPDLQYASEARTIVGEALSLAWQGEDYEDALKAASEELQKLYDEQYQ
ncbi:MAG: ABC transporter substrate-binding protein, partial [Blautia hydrogenotrophica]